MSVFQFGRGRLGYLFQGRFSSCVLDERHLLAAAAYGELNPVRVGMVKRAWAYPWSSAAFHVGRRNTDLLVEDRTLRGLVENWMEYLNSATPEKNQEIRKMTRTGRPVGEASFMRLIERLTARDLSKRKPGRPSRK